MLIEIRPRPFIQPEVFQPGLAQCRLILAQLFIEREIPAPESAAGRCGSPTRPASTNFTSAARSPAESFDVSTRNGTGAKRAVIRCRSARVELRRKRKVSLV